MVLRQLKSCDPVLFAPRADFDLIFNEMLEEYGRQDYEKEELEAKKTCLFQYLRDYIKFSAAPKPTDQQINSLYKKTLKMIEGAIDAREMQVDNVLSQKQDLEDMLSEEIEWDVDTYEVTEGKETSHIRDDLGKIRDIDLTVQELRDDEATLEKMKDKCLTAQYADNPRFEKHTCIETFVHSTHSRGPYLSTSCGFPMPEVIVEYNRDEHLIEDLGIPAAELTQMVLDCLANKK